MGIKALVATLVCVIGCGATFAQPSIISSESAALAHISLFDRFHANPSTLAQSQSPSISLDYSDRYLIAELSRATLSADVPIKVVNVAALVSRFGYVDFHDVESRLTFAKSLSPHIDLGVSGVVDVHSHVGMEHAAVRGGVSVGAVWNVGMHQVGATVEVRMTDDVGASASVSYRVRVKNSAVFGVECERSLDGAYRPKMAAEYFSPHISIRGGMMANPVSPTFGVGVPLRRIDIDVAGEYAAALGASISVCLSVKVFRSRSEE